MSQNQTIKRSKALSVTIIIIALSTLNALRIAVFDRSFFVSLFPGAIGGVYIAYLIVALLLLIALGGLWFLKRWSILMLVGLTIVTLVLDQIASAPMAHKIASLIAALLILIMSRPVWSRRKTN